MTDELITKVGIGVAILRGSKVLLGKRKGSHGEGEWAFPGGSMEHLETFNSTALREIAEECGPSLKVRDLAVVSVLNLTEYAPKHYIDIGMVAIYQSGSPQVMEPDKCEEWEWFEISELPSPRFATIDRVLQAAISNAQGQVTVYDKE